MNKNLSLCFNLFFSVFNNFSVGGPVNENIELRDLNIKESLLIQNNIKSMDLKEEIEDFFRDLKYLKFNENFNINKYDNNDDLNKNDSNLYKEINHLKKSKHEDFRIFFFRILKCYLSFIGYINN